MKFDREFWRKVLVDASAHIVALLVVAAVTGTAGYFVGHSRAEAQNEIRVRSEALNYAAELKHTIDRANATLSQSGGANPDNLRVYARSIVKVRDDLRGSLLSLSSQLNSDLDRLSMLLDQYEKDRNETVAHDMTVNIRVLHETWPSRQARIDSAVRRLMVDLGLERISFVDRKKEF
jgi:hypothetical protein